ncbi:hypothetical protein B0T24DRAFT_206736 [Lasiosphaeria ovina]|uniref:Uncharacterized protein n=1 Tax=Lasiosphaeria ovina TaxID=92902 RepID=A0AAE0KGE6_9PEZI|nr:hypothetical protein B0T24DRAFT_206736 [Lasiosphaeria ovina]
MAGAGPWLWCAAAAAAEFRTFWRMTEEEMPYGPGAESREGCGCGIGRARERTRIARPMRQAVAGERGRIAIGSAILASFQGLDVGVSNCQRPNMAVCVGGEGFYVVRSIDKAVDKCAFTWHFGGHLALTSESPEFDDAMCHASVGS